VWIIICLLLYKSKISINNDLGIWGDFRWVIQVKSFVEVSVDLFVRNNLVPAVLGLICDLFLSML